MSVIPSAIPAFQFSPHVLDLSVLGDEELCLVFYPGRYSGVGVPSYIVSVLVCFSLLGESIIKLSDSSIQSSPVIGAIVSALSVRQLRVTVRLRAGA